MLAAVDTTQGTAKVGAADVWKALTSQADAANASVVVASRFPRAVAGLIVGFALGVAGAALQAVTRNVLAAPEHLRRQRRRVPCTRGRVGDGTRAAGHRPVRCRVPRRSRRGRAGARAVQTRQRDPSARPSRSGARPRSRVHHTSARPAVPPTDAGAL
ncbi:iron chelate uptake ABC transporter family permease subunit [Sphingomonas sp. LR61]